MELGSIYTLPLTGRAGVGCAARGGLSGGPERASPPTQATLGRAAPRLRYPPREGEGAH